MNRFLLSLILFIMGLIVPTVSLVMSIQFDQQCGGYLKQTADANTVELALERINVAIDYMEKNDLTDGYTSVLWRTEDENVGYWYRNIVACRDELEANLDASSLEKSNVLMKVRETLTDDGGESGTKLTVPPGISRFPHNAGFGILNTISAILLLLGCVALGVALSEY